MENIYAQNWEDCEYCEQSYYEHDTGYSEYECELVGGGCFGGGLKDNCPLSFKYQIE